jgi:hypothetical protein
MIHETSLLEAIRQSGVTRIAIIDDAFDAPDVDDDSAGKVIEYLEGKAFAALRNELGIAEEVHQRAQQALGESDYDSEDLRACIEVLYIKFIITSADDFDPGGIFAAARGANLEHLRPILSLLAKCDPQLDIEYIGSKPEDLSKVGEGRHLIFIDFYLSPSLPAGETPSARQKTEAKAAAVDRVTKLIDEQASRASSVVLMSSHSVRAEAEKFRAKLNKDRSRVFASRFTFIEKTQVTLLPDGEIALKEEAADALLDIFQSYEFGRALDAGLNCWLESAAKAVEDIRGEIEHLDLKDFAYLVRFRLAQEGQMLFEYLEWFFGECLLDSVGKAVDEAAAADEQVRALNGPTASRIEGAFDGPTKKVAELYHRVRIESPRANPTGSYRLGDLYLVSEGKARSVVAVMTPDCDLIMREGEGRGAMRLLTVSGKLRAFEAPEASVSDFVMIKGKPYNIAWNRKSLATKEFDGWPAPGVSSDDLEYIGALRPLYAQELQRKLLHDLGRVGVSVAPAIGMTAAVQVCVKDKSGRKVVVNDTLSKGELCYVVPGRGGSDKARVIFRRQFVGKLISTLSQKNPESLLSHAKGNVEQLKRSDAYNKLAKMFRSGICFEEAIDLGIFLTSNPALKGSVDGTWCWLVVSMNRQE